MHGEPHFVLADICKVLEIKNPTDVAKRLDEDERTRFNLGRQGKATVINESGLYAVILRSDKPQAKQFRKWVISDVLPKLRKTGNYSVKPTEDYKTRLLSQTFLKPLTSIVKYCNISTGGEKWVSKIYQIS